MKPSERSNAGAFPRLALVRQCFPARPPLAVRATLAPQLAPLTSQVRPGCRVGVAVGSRGISDLAQVVEVVLDWLKGLGASPFLLPAMGSHGGATAEGQVALLAEYGITAERFGVPVCAAMEVERVGTLPDGVDVLGAQEALRADGLILINRIKPHTDFSGALGSGLLKMLVVGLGKHLGAAAFHRAASRLGYESVLRAAGQVLLDALPVWGAVAILEDQRHQLAQLTVVRREEFVAREESLCAEAKRLMPRLPLDEVDLLIVDRMGKNISGAGMDPAVIGRLIHGYTLAEDQPQPSPRVRRLFVRELTPQSRGNAIGIGMADFTTSRLVQAMNREITVTNSLTALSLQGAKVPIYFDTDRDVLSQALASLALAPGTPPRVVRIRDTLSVEYLAVSEACVEHLAGRADLEVLRPAEPMSFDMNGDLLPLPVP
ncbi:MAG: DUF2088 domain-containing protein [Verrucomicrobia bacterium]|nr:DUF2088 domain-containing protein [Verrucomicrobiota bacterium]